MKSSLTHVSVVIKVHPDHCKSFPDPNGKGRKRIIAQVSVDEIYRARIDFGPNPRNQKLTTKVSEAIADGLTANPGWFLYFNRGIVLNAESAEFDNKTHELTITFQKDAKNPTESPFGNLDGGHTNRVIINEIQTNGWRNFELAGEKQYVNLEILIGIEKEKLPKLVGARNTNVQVRDLSLLVAGDDLNWLKDICEAKGVKDKINWRQFDDNGDMMGEDVIATLSLLNPKLEPKTRCYNSPGRIISELKTDKNMMDGLRSQSSIAFEFLKFVDHIHASFEKWYDDCELKGKKKIEGAKEKKQSGFGKLKGVSRGEHNLIFLGKTIDYRIVKSWLLPLAFSFTRVVAHSPKDPVNWYKVSALVGPKLYSTLQLQTNEANHNLDKVGKSQPVWSALEAIVWAEYCTHRLAAL